MMKTTIIAITSYCCLYLFCACNTTRSELELMRNLDKVVECRDEYFARHKTMTDSIKSAVAECHTPKETWDCYRKLHQSYSTFSIDSAALYASKMEETALQICDNERLFLSRIARISALHAQFEYNTCRRLFEQLDTTDISLESMAEYWSLGSRLYRDHLRYTECSETEKALYSARLEDLRKGLSGDGYHISRDCRLKTALIHIDRGDWETAQQIIYNIEQEGNLTIHERAIASYYLSKTFKLTGEEDKRKEALIKAVAFDLMMPNRESFSMWELSQLLFQEGDYERAADYMTLTLREALACNFKILYIRAIDAKETIANAIQENNSRMNRILLIGIILALLALGIISFMFSYSNRQRRRIAKANDTIKAMNRKLAKVNSELTDANQIKDNYVSLYMKLATHYIRQVDEERSHLRKLARTEGLDGIMKILRSPKFADNEYKLFYQTFDKTFISLFPHFIEKINELLPEEARLSSKNDGSLSTELRILAVIRLGITKSPEIADVLNCAIRTVYKYRITLRSIALCDKDEFEKRVREIDI